PLNMALDAVYIGNHGVAQPAVFNLNASTTIGADIAGQPLFPLFNRKTDTNLRYVGFGSSYHALQIKLDRRFSKGLLITSGFTWAKAEGMQSEDVGLRFYINPRRNWERLDFDRRKTSFLGYVYQLPFGTGKRFMNARGI